MTDETDNTRPIDELMISARPLNMEEAKRIGAIGGLVCGLVGLLILWIMVLATRGSIEIGNPLKWLAKQDEFVAVIVGSILLLAISFINGGRIGQKVIAKNAKAGLLGVGHGLLNIVVLASVVTVYYVFDALWLLYESKKEAL